MATFSNYTVAKELAGVDTINNNPYTIDSSLFRDPIRIGTGAGSLVQGQQSIAIGKDCGQTQGDYDTAVGSQCGKSSGGATVSVGFGAGSTLQSFEATAVGFEAGSISAGSGSVAVGANSGAINHGLGAVSVGNNSAYIDSGIYSISIGHNACTTASSDHTITLNSSGLAQNNTTLNTIVINASDVAISTSGNPGFYVSPVAENTSQSGSVTFTPSTAGFSQILYYNPTTKEIRACNYAS